jgi:hypothetical protein
MPKTPSFCEKRAQQTELIWPNWSTQVYFHILDTCKRFSFSVFASHLLFSELALSCPFHFSFWSSLLLVSLQWALFRGPNIAPWPLLALLFHRCRRPLCANGAKRSFAPQPKAASKLCLLRINTYVLTLCFAKLRAKLALTLRRYKNRAKRCKAQLCCRAKRG